MEAFEKDDLVLFQNELHDILEEIHAGADEKIELPQIAAVGGQSSGKSSVMEAFVGHPFLPRGSGIVTRCPIILVNKTLTNGAKEWMQFDHITKKFTNFKQVEEEIRNRTDEIAGTNLGITSEPIKITFYSPNVLNLTIVDLPGLVEVPTGDQPEDIQAQVEDLVMSYIGQDQTVILAVVPGNNDIATAKSLKFVQEVDPYQKRTIAVVTKLDLVQDEDKEKMAEVLTGNVKPLNINPPVGVINRSAGPDSGNLSAAEASAFERHFLRTNYPDIAKDHGSTFLAKKLHRILHKKIAESCHGILGKVRHFEDGAQADLRALGDNEDLSEDEKRQVLIDTIDDFEKAYRTQVQGQGKGEITTQALIRGTRLDFIIGQRLNKELDSVKVFENMTDVNIMIGVRNAMPVGARMIIPEVALHHFVTEEIKRIAPTAYHSADLCFQEMVGMIHQCVKDNERFPRINTAISFVINALLVDKVKEAKSTLATFFKIQAASALTANPQYANIFKESMGAIGIVDLGSLPVDFLCKLPHGNERLCTLLDSSTFNPEGPTDFTDDQKKLCAELRKLSENVYGIVKCQAQDYIINTIICILLNETVSMAGKTLNMQLNRSDKIEQLVKEPDDIQVKRAMLREKVERYGKAGKRIQDVINGAA